MHALVRELLELMPMDGDPWPRAERQRWTAALAAVLDVVYDDDGVPVDLPEPEGVVDLRPARGRHARGGLE